MTWRVGGIFTYPWRDVFLVFSERNPVEETERSIQTLVKLASNPECVPALIDGLGPYLSTIMAITEQHENCVILDKHLMTLLNTLIQVSVPGQVYDNVYDIVYACVLDHQM